MSLQDTNSAYSSDCLVLLATGNDMTFSHCFLLTSSIYNHKATNYNYLKNSKKFRLYCCFGEFQQIKT